ncbi:protein disulfide isomerase [Colletotrichum karsti]|uniref:Protein disulfide isomerase n=1 Tax=Colletotrichum karsti TaxID=1095194 RepID=A0A9P6LGW6_9PEZI|nr:protein disulfide isomerase [Colletotrichum karsti]KAF9872010.1 protein disulfide isomerase [Colletotrichum karsti]
MSLKSVLPMLALVGSGLGWQHKTEAYVRDAIATNEYSLIAFVARASDASKALEPHWGAVEDAIPTALSVDCETSSALCADFDVASFPAIRFYRPDGTKRHYRGPRKGSEIGSFVNRMRRPVINPVEKETMSSFRSSDDVVLVAHFTLEETSLRDRYADLAERYHDRYAFGLTDIPESPGRIACYNNVIGAMQMSSELEDVDAMDKLLKKCAAPLVPRLTRRNEAEYLNAGKSLVYFFARIEQYLDAWTSAVVPLAKKYHQYITFVTVDLTDYPEMPAMFGLPSGIEDAVALQNPATGQVFPFTGEITIDAVEQFITDISEGNVEPWDGQTILEVVEVDADDENGQGHSAGQQTQEGAGVDSEKASEKSPEEKSETHDEL